MNKLAIIQTYTTGVSVSYIDSKDNYSNWTKQPLARNFMDGVHNSDSKYIIRLDGDDFQSDYYLNYGLHLIESNNLDALSPVYLVDNTWELIDKPQGSGIFYRRDLFLECGGYDESLDYQCDLDFYIRFTRKYEIVVNKHLVYLWKARDGRSFKNKDIFLEKRKEILDRYNMKDDEVHHFGSYAYIK